MAKNNTDRQRAARRRQSGHYNESYLTAYLDLRAKYILDGLGLSYQPGNLSKVKLALTQVEKDGFIRGMLCTNGESRHERSQNGVDRRRDNPIIAASESIRSAS